jgi:hypothetical protein
MEPALTALDKRDSDAPGRYARSFAMRDLFGCRRRSFAGSGRFSPTIA